MGKTYLQGETLTALDLNNSLSEMVNTTGSFTFTGVHTHDANVILNTPLILNTNSTLVSSNTITDRQGNVRSTPINTAANGSYTLDRLDAGRVVTIQTGPVIVPLGVFAAGDSITIWNRSTSPIIIAGAGGLSMYTAGQNVIGNKTLAGVGLCTLLFINSTTVVITGIGIS